MKAKRCYSLFLVLALCLSLFPISAAAEEVIEYNLWVQGTQVTSLNASDVLGNGTVSYNPTENTLTLNDANITKDVTSIISTPNPGNCAVYYSGSETLMIDLSGENSITSNLKDNEYALCCGFYSSAGVTFEGSGSLKVVSGKTDSYVQKCYGIKINGSSKIESGTSVQAIAQSANTGAYPLESIGFINEGGVLTVSGSLSGIGGSAGYTENSSPGRSVGISVSPGMVVKEGANVTAKSDSAYYSFGMRCVYQRDSDVDCLTVNGGSVTATGGDGTQDGCGIHIRPKIAGKGLILDGGKVMATCLQGKNSYGIQGTGNGIVLIQGGELIAIGSSVALTGQAFLEDGLTVFGSPNINGSGAEAYEAGNYLSYKWFKSSATASSNGEPPSPPSDKEARPNVSFEATDEESGLLSDMVPETWYHISGATARPFTVWSHNGKAVLPDLFAGDLHIVKQGNPPQTTDSEPQIIELTKADTPKTVNALACTTTENNNGKLQNVNDTMEYKPATQAGGSWTKITGTEVNGLNAGSYAVRVRASGRALASGNQVVTVEKYVAPPLSSGSSGSGSGKHSHTVQKETQKAQISYGENKENIDIKTDKQKGSALVELKDIKSASGKAIVVNMPEIKDIVKNILSVDVSQLLKKSDDSSITMKTDIAVVSLPSNMLTDVENITGNRAELSVAEVKKSDLPERAKEKIGIRPVVALTISIDHRVLKWRSEATAVKVTIPYIPTAHELEHPERITAYYIDENGNFMEVEGARYDKERKGVVFSTNHFSYYTVGYKEEVANEKGDLNFSDVTASDWYYEAVKYITEKGITKGVGDGKFGAHQALTRGQFIVMFMRAYGIEADTENVDNFSDAGDTYYTNYLAKAKKLGITKGIGDNKFAPEKAVSREEMFTLIYSGLKALDKLPKEDNGKALSDFVDGTEVSSWAKEATMQLVKNGIVAGSNGKIKPTEGLSRAEMAQVLYNLLASK